MLRSLRALLLLLLPLAALAQEFDGGSDFLVRVWRSEEGLPGNVARSVGQSTDGYLWIVTAEGLARFDGRAFRTIRMPDGELAPPDGLFRVFTPRDGSVWVSSYRGGLYRVVDGILEPVGFDMEALGRGVVTTLFIHDEAVHFHYNDRIWRVNADDTVEAATDSPGLAGSLAAEAEAQARRGRSREHSASPTELVDRDGGRWRIDRQTLSYTESEGTSPVIRIPGLEGELGVGDMLEDIEGNLWLASGARGLIRIRHRRVSYLGTGDGPYDKAVNTCVRSADGTWWIAPRAGGLDRIRDGVASHVPVSSQDTERSIACLFEDRSGRLWVGSRDGSLFELNRQTGKVEARFSRSPEVSKISAIAEDSEGRLWFGGPYGLCRWDGGTLETFADAPLLAGVEIESMAVGAEDELFAGSTDGRVFLHDGKGFKLLRNPRGAARKQVSAILPLGPNELWIATIGDGLHLLKDGRWHDFGLEAGLPEDRLTGLAHTGSEALWLGSLGGIIRVSRVDLFRSLVDPDYLPRWLKLDRSDGMITRECVGNAQPGVFRDADDKLWFPTSTGLATVNARKLQTNRVPPPVFFGATEVDGVPVPTGDAPLIVGPGRVRLGFHFVGISLAAPEKVTYKIQLSGLDEQPQWVGPEARADYQAVPPGRYTFHVTAINGDGIPSSQAAILPIEVRPHFWETAWFLALALIGALLVALGTGWLVARRRMKAKLREIRTRQLLESERSRISRDLHDDLGASLTELSILSALAAEDHLDEDAQPPLDQLSVKAKLVVGTLDEIVWATNPTQDTLKSLVEYVAFFAEEFLKTVKVPLHTEIANNIPEVMIGPRRRHAVLLASREALNNAVKHAKPSLVDLHIAVTDGQLVVTVRDNGKGFAVDYAVSGNGLSNLRKRMTDCGGGCEIDSVPGEGSTVTLTLPLPTGPSAP